MGEPRNVLLVVVDGARADRFSCYGHERETTPFLDRLAREGVRFTNAFANAPWSLPAHACLFTGLATSAHGASDESPFLAPSRPTLAELLRQAGFRTAAFCANPWVSPATGFGRGFDSFHTPLGDGRSMARAAFYARRATDRLLRRSDAGARRTNLAFYQWAGAAEQPFFAFVHYGEARLQQSPPSPYERLFLGSEVGRGELRAVERARKSATAAEEREASRSILGGLYDGALRYVDQRIEELGRFLEKRGRWEDTLVIVTADHGEDLGEHGRPAGSFGLYDTLLHVPLLLRCPGLVPQGFVVDELSQQIDLLPTVLHLLGQDGLRPPVQGRPLLHDGRATAGPAFVVAERFRPGAEIQRRFAAAGLVAPADVRQRAVRTRREKYVWRSDENNELYDLAVDPGERQNRIDTSPARAAALRAQLFDWLATVPADAAADPTIAIEEDTRQQA